MITIDHKENNVRDKIDHWIQWMHVLQLEHFSDRLWIVLELSIDDHGDHSHLHFYFKNVRE